MAAVRAEPVSQQRRIRIEHCMGTVFSLDLRTPEVEDEALDAAARWLHWVDATFSTYRPDSWISRLGRGDLAETDCPPVVGQVLSRGKQLSLETSGYFSLYAAGSLDPSGLVKGWAIERASDILVTAGSISHCLNGGGDVQCVGDAGTGKPWRVGIADPHHPGQVVAVLAGPDLAVATSGETERGHHIHNPHGAVEATGLASITLIGRHLRDVDAYATAAFAMGDAARSWVEGLEGVEAFTVMSDGGTWYTDGLFLEPSGTLTVRRADTVPAQGSNRLGQA
jgi:thiamine biosynthesis lipoprotein